MDDTGSRSLACETVHVSGARDLLCHVIQQQLKQVLAVPTGIQRELDGSSRW